MDKWLLLVGACLLHEVLTVEIELGSKNQREARKLFGGYRITPRFCKPSRRSALAGPAICMFNHECGQRGGQVAGACMDGFLFGACCHLPAGANGDLIESDVVPVTALDNALPTPTIPSLLLESHGVSQIAQSLLQQQQVLPTAQDNAMVQVNAAGYFATNGVTHTKAPETILLADGATTASVEDRKTTVVIEDATVPYSDRPLVHISVSSPMFRPKPDNKYVLVPTFTKPDPQVDSIVNIVQLLDATTTRKPPSTSYVYSATRPGTTTTRKPPSTSYVFSTTSKPRKTTPHTTTTIKKKKPTKSSGNKKVPTSTTARPVGHSTISNSPLAFITTKKPPSTSYVYSSTPTRRPPSTINSHVVGPAFSVTSAPAQYSSYASPAPTLIVLSPITAEDGDATEAMPETTQRPSYSRPQQVPNRKPPVNTVTINNNVVQNIYSTDRPQPTVLITPKPSVSSSYAPPPSVDSDEGVEVGSDDSVNFPPVRNPNLNMSSPILNEDDITTPAFVEDDALNANVESFVNKIIQGLQEPFEGLKDVVYNRTSSALTSTTTKKPVKKQGTSTKRPSSRPGSSTTRKPTRRPSTVATRKTTTTKKPRTTRRPPVTTTIQSFIEEEEESTLPGEEEYRNQCGVRPLLKTGRIVGGKGAAFGEFPWQVLVRESTWLGLFTKNKCGGVLISAKYVMTAAHCQPGFLASLVAVFGEFDISGDLESRRHISRNVRRVVVHRKYDAATFENDLALLELEAPVKFDAHIIPICLPREGEDFTGRMATVTGWGRLKYGGGVPSVLQEVQVPIMENHVCQEMFRTAGHSKVILESFLCAGYANGQKDSCEGDSGGPLVLHRPDGRYQLAGTVSHGIKCAAPYLPGVYMRTAYYKPWITAITGIDTI